MNEETRERIEANDILLNAVLGLLLIGQPELLDTLERSVRFATEHQPPDVRFQRGSYRLAMERLAKLRPPKRN